MKDLILYATMPKDEKLINADTLILHNSWKEAKSWIMDDRDFYQVKTIKLIIL